ncbi:hypothetical protein SI65_07475 [Aspergillus cristatus]|uniref:Uncharacterized protein n=1 Tax=Aspergillus cristatus TaxID=573508 RepID=A0A1E3B9K0_ASPCR|nr:hypothetical protein SI65_07475 [Aspergillus cristatus]
MVTKGAKSPASGPPSIPSALRTALVHHLVAETIEDNSGEVIVQSDILQPDFLEAMNGHKMNRCAVATSSIHGDVAFTLAKYLFSRIRPHSPIPASNVKNMQVKQGLIVRKDRSRPQWIQIRSTADLSAGLVHLSWHQVDGQGEPAEDNFATAVVEYGDQGSWLQEWSSTGHLVASRIDVLQRLADEGTASRLSRDMVYTLFGNLVDYADKYRGMQTVVLHDGPTVLYRQCSASSRLHSYGGNALDARRNFFVTPGWKSMRFAKPLVPGGQYVSYVKMIPVHEQPGFYAGDVYVLQDDQIVGLVGGITFRTFPRLLLDQFFSLPDTTVPGQAPVHTTPARPMQTRIDPQAPTPAFPTESPSQATMSTDTSASLNTSTKTPAVSPATDNGIVSQAIALIVEETEIEASEVSDETELSSIGIDSLLSLVLAQKFRTELQLDVRNSLFMDCLTIGDLRTWLVDYC